MPHHGIVIPADPIKSMNHGIVIPSDPIESTNHEIVSQSDPIESFDHEIVMRSDPIESMSDRKINDDDSITDNCTSNVSERGHGGSLVGSREAIEVYHVQNWNVDETTENGRPPGEHDCGMQVSLMRIKFRLLARDPNPEIRSGQRSFAQAHAASTCRLN